MIEVFGFLLRTTFKNRITRRVARLREPRYLIPFAVSLLWFFAWVLRPMLGRGAHWRVVDWGVLPPNLREAIVFIGGIGIFLWIMLLWILPDKKAALAFSPAELHFLFPAPVTRRQLVQYKLLQAQVGILFGSFVSAFFFGARFMHADGWARVLAFWLFFAIAHLHGIAASFVRTDLIEAGWTAFRRRALSIAVALVIVLAVFFSAREPWNALAVAASSLIRPDGDIDLESFKAVAEALAHAGNTGLASIVLWPFLALPRLLLASTPGEFLGYGGVGFVILLLHYVWVIRSDTSFEEASLELSQKAAERRAERQDSRRRGGRLVMPTRAFPWKLAPTGAPETALVWKNLINLTRVTPMRALFALVLFMLAMIWWTIQMAEAQEGPWFVAAILSALLAGFTALLGPVFVRNDLREDLFRIDAIKTMPLPGHAIVWSEILGSWTALALILVSTITFGAVALYMSGAKVVGGVEVSWLFAGAGAALVALPAVALVAVGLQNALVILFPAWVALGNSRARGFEASGQRILSMFGTVFALGVVGLPAALSFGALVWLLAPQVGPESLVIGAVVASAWMVAEVWLACRLLGKVVDRLDPSTAGIESEDP